MDIMIKSIISVAISAIGLPSHSHVSNHVEKYAIALLMVFQPRKMFSRGRRQGRHHTGRQGWPRFQCAFAHTRHGLMLITYYCRGDNMRRAR